LLDSLLQERWDGRRAGALVTGVQPLLESWPQEG